MKGALVEFGNFQKLELLTLDAAELSLSSRNMDVCLLSTNTTMLLLSKCLSKFILSVFSVLRVRHRYSVHGSEITACL